MSSDFQASCFMGVTNSQVFLSDKDLNDMELIHNVSVRSSAEDHEQRGAAEQRRASMPLKIRIPSCEERDINDEEEENEGFKTPTSAIHKTSEILHCPPAPRKPKSLPSLKRRASRPVLLLDLSREINSLFPSPIVFDLGGKIKKVKKPI